MEGERLTQGWHSASGTSLWPGSEQILPLAPSAAGGGVLERKQDPTQAHERQR